MLRIVLARTGDLAGWRVVVTAGGTQEAIDPVRYVSNHSSGKMGYAVAEAARDRGASVVLVTAPTALLAPLGVEVRRVVSAADMHDAVLGAVADADLLVMAAAVADYRPAQVADAEDQEEGRRADAGACPTRPTSWRRRRPSRAGG